ncbi:MAG TPA: Lrp/AsnC family transcriptional regulator [Thermoplasmata archaeon]|nr:Lrp/AsnC family transcriptional regulator [Thermoplasmata archaeon]
MDATDVRIFCELAYQDTGFRAFTRKPLTPPEIARKLRLDEKTVRLRVRRMEESGFIKYYQATPELAAFGLRCLALYRFEAMNVATKISAIQHARGLPGVLQAFDYLGPTFSVSLVGASSAELQRLAEEIAGRFELRKQGLGEEEIGERHAHPDRIGWRIIERLRYNARASHKEVAEGLSITPRMAEYRTRKLLDSGAVLVRAVINPQRQEGLVFYELGVTTDLGKHAAVVNAVRKRFGERLWSTQESPSGVLLLSLFGFTLAEPEEAAMEIEAMPGVRWCSILILKEVLEPARPNWIDVLIQEEITSARQGGGSREPARPP